MSIPMDAYCIECHMRRNLETARKLGDNETVTQFAKELMKLYLALPEDRSSPELGPYTSELFCKLFGVEWDRRKQEKIDSNRFVLERLDTIRGRVEGAPEPLYAALQFSILGNYLDFAALQGKVSFEQLDQMLDEALEMNLDRHYYEKLRQDLQKGKKLLLLTDNAGEIGFDRILAEQIQKDYPQLEITFCVRGMPIHNDATREDAQVMGITFPVIDSGSAVGGTVIEQLSVVAKAALDSADVIIAKGMGNTETMYPCGYNVYYAFLIKCQRVVDFFQKPMMTPMLIRDPDYKE